MTQNYLLTHRLSQEQLPSEGLDIPKALVVFAFVRVLVLIIL